MFSYRLAEALQDCPSFVLSSHPLERNDRKKMHLVILETRKSCIPSVSKAGVCTPPVLDLVLGVKSLSGSNAETLFRTTFI